jgi:hypothetical protein
MIGCRVNKKKNPFVQVDRDLVRDRRLTPEAKGIMMYLLDNMDGYVVRSEDIRKENKVGRDKLQRIFKELEAFGYAKLIRVKDRDNRFLGTYWDIYEDPLRLTEKPVDGKVVSDNNTKGHNTSALHFEKIKSMYEKTNVVRAKKGEGQFSNRPDKYEIITDSNGRAVKVMTFYERFGPKEWFDKKVSEMVGSSSTSSSDPDSAEFIEGSDSAKNRADLEDKLAQLRSMGFDVDIQSGEIVNNHPSNNKDSDQHSIEVDDSQSGCVDEGWDGNRSIKYHSER